MQNPRSNGLTDPNVCFRRIQEQTEHAASADDQPTGFLGSLQSLMKPSCIAETLLKLLWRHQRVEAIASRLEAIALRSEAIAIGN